MLLYQKTHCFLQRAAKMGRRSAQEKNKTLFFVLGTEGCLVLSMAFKNSRRVEYVVKIRVTACKQ